MGVATDITREALKQRLTAAEEHHRREAERARDRTTTTLSGEIVDRPEPEVAPVVIQPRRVDTWD